MHRPVRFFTMRFDAPDLVGETIAGRYRVERKLGEGGMGTVWRVVHVESLQKYALKMLHPKTASDRINVERFLREARAAAALQSRHVVRIVDAQMSHVDGKTKQPRPFLVMELLNGSNLEQIISMHGAIEPAQVVWVLQQVARALDMAHAKGIIHRDLKPENLFLSVDEEGEAVMKVCDFGIAKLEGESSGLVTHDGMGTAVGATIGTPMYMAPEQARNAAAVVPATDQWAVALIAFRALTAREYFAGATSSADLLLKIVTDPLVLPSKRDDRIGAEFDAWFMRSCDRDPAARWKSVGAQIAALKEALGVETAVAPKAVPMIDAMATAKTEPLTPSDESAAEHRTTPPASARTQTDRGTTKKSVGSSLRWILVAAASVVVGAVGAAAYLQRTRSSTTSTSSSPSTGSTSSAITATTTTAEPIAPFVAASSSASIAAPASQMPSTTIVTNASVASAEKKPKLPPKPTTSAPIAALPSATTNPAVPSMKPKLASGAACDHNADCASGICAAYTCE